MTDDLVKRLRDTNGGWASDEALAAADRIEELEAKLAKAVSVQEAAKVLMSAGDEVLLQIAVGYDGEDSAQRGEPNPHDLDFCNDDTAEWVSERIACASEGLRALAELKGETE